jgi:arylsulfatase A-like enzyme
VTFRTHSKSEVTISIQQHYAAMVTMVDEWIGKVVATLKKNEQYGNTVILFASDHGEMLGDFGLFSKTYMYEGSVRVPLIVSGPGVTARGRSAALAELVDLYPTILDLAGCAYERERLDGISLAPILTGTSKGHKVDQFSEWGGVEAPPYARRRMLFDGRYKLIDTLGFKELYDLDADPKESSNVAQKNVSIVAKLETAMQGYSQKALPPLRLSPRSRG